MNYKIRFFTITTFSLSLHHVLSDETHNITDSKRSAPKPMSDLPPGVGDIEGYEMVAKKFIGINPINDVGSGFILRESQGNDIKRDGFPGNMPPSNTGRKNMCTCECVAGRDGIGCVGYAGIAFRYNSMLWKDPLNPNAWTGQMQGNQGVSAGRLNFLGSDVRMSPGGSVIYNVACTDRMCKGLFSGVFRQSNNPVSCLAVLAEIEAGDESEDYCSVRCSNNEAFSRWIAYCAADEEDESLGFSGYGI